MLGQGSGGRVMGGMRGIRPRPYGPRSSAMRSCVSAPVVRLCRDGQEANPDGSSKPPGAIPGHPARHNYATKARIPSRPRVATNTPRPHRSTSAR